jgi:hypothetical protein
VSGTTPTAMAYRIAGEQGVDGVVVTLKNASGGTLGT